MMLRVFLPVTFIVLPVLAPINRLSGTNAQTAFLDVFSISNVAPRHAASRLWLHWALGTLVVAWVCYVVHDETLAYVKAKQRYTSGRSYRAQPSANTILVANIPETLLTYEKLKKVFDVFPGGVRDIHISRDTRSLSSMLSKRDQIVEAIELAETKLIAMCVSEHTGVHRGLKRSIWTPRIWLDVLGKKGTGQARASRSKVRSQPVEDRSFKDRPLRCGSKLGFGKQDSLAASRHGGSPNLSTQSRPASTSRHSTAHMFYCAIRRRLWASRLWVSRWSSSHFARCTTWRIVYRSSHSMAASLSFQLPSYR